MSVPPAHPVWTLASLLEGWCAVATVQDVSVGGLALDSRRVEPGDVFCAVQGAHTHGLAHVDEALARGAAAVLA
jgi:UDP-N-acetylmuramoyl-L-alanyl-D-glutamate--2,6-diaminopimelate ligase